MLETCQVGCPYCGETIEVVIDCSEPEQSYYEDCFVCCRPILFHVEIDMSGQPNVSVRRDDD